MSETMLQEMIIYFYVPCPKGLFNPIKRLLDDIPFEDVFYE